ncbi:FAD-dependent oxidoreductase [uncultured Cloacibacillus sp.]|uniref:NAD(P)/FAD-dependent oxidoreductase n=1 Tax=uncultured Cloacibacillus sp. TaxID=889794 RepID=UPI0025D81058|nr:FAD-dependent oxidoreductase [uncultured Cloacibacillus sp.]
MKHLIIGASAAGIAAARKIRALRPGDEITIVAKDGAPHSRCMLHHFIGGHKSAEEINFAGADFFDKNRAEFIAGEEITKVLPDEKAVVGAKSGKIFYDKLLITTGARYFIPPVPGFRDGKNVYGLRDIDDARKISEAARSAKQCVIVGSGLVGLDAAYALAERGVRCRIVEMENRLCPLQLDETAAAPYKALFEKAGCEFYLSKKASAAELDEDGNVTAVTLDDGTRLPADFLVVSAGVRPNIEFLEGSGIALDRRIVTDEHMRASVPDVYAAGDAAGLSGIWPNAALQGEIAAKNMCGVEAEYTDRYAMKNTMNFFGLTTLSLGPNAAKEGDEVLTAESRSGYAKAIIRGDALVHLTIQGDIGNTGFWQEIIKRGINPRTPEKPLAALSYADFWKYDEASGKYAWE